MLSYTAEIEKVPPPRFDNDQLQVHYEQIQSTVEKRTKIKGQKIAC